MPYKSFSSVKRKSAKAAFGATTLRLCAEEPERRTLLSQIKKRRRRI